jgi:hypothetical protein
MGLSSPASAAKAATSAGEKARVREPQVPTGMRPLPAAQLRRLPLITHVGGGIFRAAARAAVHAEKTPDTRYRIACVLRYCADA